MTEVDSSRKKAVHDELARLLVQYLRQQSADEDHIPKLLDVRKQCVCVCVFGVRHVHSPCEMVAGLMEQSINQLMK